MFIYKLLFLVFLTTHVSSKFQHLTGNEDIFEDALLEHLREVRDREDHDVYYDEEEDDDEEHEEHEFTKKQLLKVLDVIRHKAHKRQEKLKKSIEDKHKLSKSKDDKILTETKRDDKETWKRNTGDEVSQRDGYINVVNKIENKVKGKENDQVASVVVDNSFEKQNEYINKVDLRSILEKDGSTIVTNPPEKHPSHAHIKQQKVETSKTNNKGLDRVSFIAVIAGCCVAAIGGLALAAYCWYKLRVESRDVENPNPAKKPLKKKKKKKEAKEEKPLSKDADMNVNAEYYNYQHAKNQIKQMEKPNNPSDKLAGEETSEDEEDEDTVYECPGLAAPGDMKVVNPMFSDGESRHSDKTSHDGSPTPPNERMDSVSSHGKDNAP